MVHINMVFSCGRRVKHCYFIYLYHIYSMYEYQILYKQPRFAYFLLIDWAPALLILFQSMTLLWIVSKAAAAVGEG